MTASIVTIEWFYQFTRHPHMTSIELIQPLFALLDRGQIEIDPYTGLIRSSPFVTQFGLWDVVYACPFKVQ